MAELNVDATYNARVRTVVVRGGKANLRVGVALGGQQGGGRLVGMTRR